MSIVEVLQVDKKVLNHLGEEIPTRIDFVPDWDCSIVHSSTISYRRAVHDYVFHIFRDDVLRELRKGFPDKHELWYSALSRIAVDEELLRRGVGDLR